MHNDVSQFSARLRSDEVAIRREPIEPKTLLLFLSVYPLTIGVSSQSRLLFGLTVVISLVYSVFFGLATGGLSVTAGVYRVGYSSVATAMFVHMLERYNRHVAGRELFLEFK